MKKSSGKASFLICSVTCRRQVKARSTVIRPFMVVLTMCFIAESLNITEAAPFNSGTSSRRNVTIISKGGKYLSVMETKLEGRNADNPYAKLELSSVGSNGEVTIKGIKSKNYVAINQAGIVRLEATTHQEAVFIDAHIGVTGYRSFQSKKYTTMYLAITGTGMVASSKDANSKAIQFAVFNN